VDLTGKTIVLYDGVCGLCNRLIRFLLRFDSRDRFRYASLQSSFAAKLLSKHGLDTSAPDSVVIVADYGLASERAYTKSDAVLFAARELGGLWRFGEIAVVLPRSLRNVLYDLIARNRYRMFGKFDTCPVPKIEDREKFVEL